MSWWRSKFTVSAQLEEEDPTLMKLLERLDVRELLIRLAPLLGGKGFVVEHWSTELSVGVGLADLQASRTTNTEAQITGLLRDYPSLHCTMGMKVSEGDAVLLHLDSIHLELNGKD